jgi:hypothetical protein
MREPLKLTLVSAPAMLPLSLNEAKLYLRLDDDDTLDDALVANLTRAAMEACERFTGRALISQTWDLFLDRWPGMAETPLAEGLAVGADLPARVKAVALPRPPLQGVLHVKTYDEADTATPWPAANYFVDTASVPGRLVARTGHALPLPGRAANGIEIRFSAGYGDAPGAVPEALRQGLRLLVAHLYEHRGDDMDHAAEISGAARLWRAYRVAGL